jgi:demethylmenaquinone methyltransferase/2-methoxy-6-polyprenyl-1,4-benzoquinol methylase
MKGTPLAPHPTLPEYYGDDSRREKFVREIFDDTAPWYDWIISFSSFGSGDWYRREALKKAGLKPGMKMLDVATGTGVVARAAREVTGSTKDVVGVDVSIGMLLSARKRIGVEMAQGMTEQLPVRSGLFDLVTVGFAMRHFADLRAAFSEYHRVLKPGGKALILEITAPESRLARGFLGFYMGGVVPLAARIYSRNPDTQKLFKYYWDTTEHCVRPKTILDTLTEAGFSDVKREVELGIFSAYSGVRND